MTLDELLATLQAYLVLAGAGCLLLILLRWATPRAWARLLPLPRLRPGYWSGGYVVLVFVIATALMPILAVTVVLGLRGEVQELSNLNQERIQDKLTHASILSSPLYLFLAVMSSLRFLRVWTGTRPGQIGLTLARSVQNIVLGVLSFLAATPIVLGLYALTAWLITPEHHPFEELVRSNFPTWEWSLLAFQTIVAAPVVEELVFRGVLQGWLRRATLPGHAIVMIFTFWKSLDGEGREPQFFAGALIALYAAALFWAYRYLPAGADVTTWNVYTGPAENPRAEDDISSETSEAAADPVAWQRWQWVNAWLSVLGSATLFGVYHAKIWPTPIPLFFLGLLLGWLALRTQSLTASMVLHGLFNAIAFVLLYWSSEAPLPPTNGKQVTAAQRVGLAASVDSCVPGACTLRRR